MSKDEDVKRTKFARFLFDQGWSLMFVREQTGISYPTLENLKFGRPVNYRQRTLRDVASLCNMTIPELFPELYGEENITIKYNTVFEKALDALCNKKNMTITLQDVHEATGVSLPILTNLNKGGVIKCRKRTIRDVAEFLEISEEELWNSSIVDKTDEEKKTDPEDTNSAKPD